jgi:general secretion pathway protein G
MLLASVGLSWLAVRREEARRARQHVEGRARAFLGLIALAVDAYSMEVGVYPTTSQGLEALRSQPSDLGNGAKWSGPYVDKPIPPDPWGVPYKYVSLGEGTEGCEVWSSGPDRQFDTDDDLGFLVNDSGSRLSR